MMDALRSSISLGALQSLDGPSDAGAASSSPAAFTTVLAGMTPEPAPKPTGPGPSATIVDPGVASVAAAGVAPPILREDEPDPAPAAAPRRVFDATVDLPLAPSASPNERTASPAADDETATRDADRRSSRRRAGDEIAVPVASAALPPVQPIITPPVDVSTSQPESAPVRQSAWSGASLRTVASKAASQSDAPIVATADDPMVSAPALSALIAVARRPDEAAPAPAPAAMPEAAASATIDMLAGRRRLAAAAVPEPFVLGVEPAADTPSAPPPAAAAVVTSNPISATATQALPVIATTPAPDARPSIASASRAGRPTAAATLSSRAPRPRTAGPAPMNPAATAAPPATAAAITAPSDPAPNASGVLAAGGADRQVDLARHAAWADGIARDIATAGADSGTAHFTVAPATLGAVSVSVSRGAEGATVRLVASSESARDALDTARPQLVAEARAQGLHIRDAQVDLAGSAGGGAGSGTHRDGGSRQPVAVPADQPRSTTGVDTNSLTTGAYGGGVGGEAGRQAQQHARQQASSPHTDRSAAASRAPDTGADETTRTEDGRYA